MIGWLHGQVLHHHGDTVVLDVHGVGYEVHVAALDAYRAGDDVELFTYMVVRADALLLFGFASVEERSFFEMLLVTPGVGPSTALTALRTMSIDELAFAVEEEDAKRIATIPGIGLKTASRIVLELKGKVVTTFEPLPSSSTPSNDAIDDALRALGYSAQEVRRALDGVTLSDDESVALREALQLLRRQ